MKITINCRFLTQPICGVQRYAIELALRLKEIDDSIVFICPKNVIHKEIANSLDARVIGHNTGYVWEQVDLPLYLNKNGKPLLINLCNTAPILYTNNIVTVHDIIFKLYPETCSLWFRRWYLFLIPRILKCAKNIITVSDFSKNELREHYHFITDNIHVIYNAVSGKFKENIYFNKKFQIPPYLFAVSSMNYHKNYHGIIEAYIKLYQQTKIAAKLIIAGGTNHCFAGMNFNIPRDIPIEFLGRISDEKLKDLYQNASAFIFPSLYEGFGIPPLEAQSCGCPVIAANTASMPEVLKDSVLYFDPYDIEDIQLAMQEILTNASLRQSLKIKGLANVKRFSWDQSAEKLYAIITNLTK